jgi:4-amino-4-deoxychorismate lyase
MNEPTLMLADGKPVYENWGLDRGLHYGDGLFETMLVRGARIRFRSQHQLRLRVGCQRLGISLDHEAAWAELDEIASGDANLMLKLIVSRGAAAARGYTPAGTEQARRLLLRYSNDGPYTAQAAFSVVTLKATLGENAALAGLKHTNRLEQVLAAIEVRGQSAQEGLLSSSSGHLISGTMSNVFLVLQGEIVTPAVDRCGIAGVMRAVVLREAKQMGWTARVAELPMTALEDCDELFVTNVRLGVQPASQLNGRALKVSAKLLQLQSRVSQLDD